jgi:hypothetical protein
MRLSKIMLSLIDRCGTSASLACAIHCAVVSVAATMLPVLGLGFVADPRVEVIMLGSSFVLASASMCCGIRVHGEYRILVVFAAALSLMAIGHNFLDGLTETFIIVTGASLVACGHILNRYLCRTCQRCGELKANGARGARFSEEGRELS